MWHIKHANKKLAFDHWCCSLPGMEPALVILPIHAFCLAQLALVHSGHLMSSCGLTLGPWERCFETMSAMASMKAGECSTVTF